MKKYLSMMMSAMLILCSAGCSGDNGNISDDEIVIFNPNDLLGAWLLITLSTQTRLPIVMRGNLDSMPMALVFQAAAPTCSPMKSKVITWS